jgi:bacteriorhodopsin
MKESKVDLRELVQLRYLDWMITTPLILLAILLYYNPDYKNVNYKTYGIVLALNWGMLAAGYGGETGKLSEMTGGVLGFIFFAILLWWMNYCCVPASANHTVFYLFAIIWTFYGVAYYMKDYEEKNISYNALDVLSKAIFGIVLWLYFGHVISFK